jgi:hypothetical protein
VPDGSIFLLYRYVTGIARAYLVPEGKITCPLHTGPPDKIVKGSEGEGAVTYQPNLQFHCRSCREPALHEHLQAVHMAGKPYESNSLATLGCFPQNLEQGNRAVFRRPRIQNVAPRSRHIRGRTRRVPAFHAHDGTRVNIAGLKGINEKLRHHAAALRRGIDLLVRASSNARFETLAYKRIQRECV